MRCTSPVVAHRVIRCGARKSAANGGNRRHDSPARNGRKRSAWKTRTHWWISRAVRRGRAALGSGATTKVDAVACIDAPQTLPLPTPARIDAAAGDPGPPTTREAGLLEFQVLSWSGLFAPKEAPKPILDKLADALNQALDDETTTKRMLDLGTDVPTRARRGPAPLAELVKRRLPAGHRSLRRRKSSRNDHVSGE